MQFDVLKVLRPSGEKWRYYFPSYCAAFLGLVFIRIYNYLPLYPGDLKKYFIYSKW